MLDRLATAVGEPLAMLRLVTVLASLASLVASLELLAARRMFRDDGALAWHVQKQRFRELSRIGFPATYPAVLVLPLTRLVAVVALLAVLSSAELPASAWPLGPLSLVIATSCALTIARQPQASGADSMELIVWFGLTFAWMQSSNPLVVQGALWFVALQSVLSYCSNGWHKAFVKSWRSGQVFPLFARHSLFGHPFLAGLADRGVRLRYVMSAVIVLETAFPLVLLTGMPGCLLLVCWAATFHLLNGVFMGLNAFIFTYFATYPAIFFCSAQVQTWFEGWLVGRA